MSIDKDNFQSEQRKAVILITNYIIELSGLTESTCKIWKSKVLASLGKFIGEENALYQSFRRFEFVKFERKLIKKGNNYTSRDVYANQPVFSMDENKISEARYILNACIEHIEHHGLLKGEIKTSGDSKTNQQDESREKNMQRYLDEANEFDTEIEMKKIFISHSTKDHDLVRKFVDHILILGLEVEKNNIFCTSIDGLGIKSGTDFKNAIYEELHNAHTVIQVITKNYKSSEVCLNEMGAAWVLSQKVIPLVAEPYNYDVGFIHANTQQIKLNQQNDLVKLYDDHKGDLFGNAINMANYLTQIKIFLDFVQKYGVNNESEKEQVFFYSEKGNVVYGKLRDGIFGHPVMEKFEESSSFHRFYFLELHFPIDVLSNELSIEENDFNTSHFNVTQIHVVVSTTEDEEKLKRLKGKNVAITGDFQGGFNQWHQTAVLIHMTEIKEEA